MCFAMIDFICSWALFFGLVFTIATYAGRRLLIGRASNDRLAGVEGALLGRNLIEGAYWCFQPLVKFLELLRVSPNMITGASLIPMSGAALAAGMGHFGIGAILATAGSLCDMLDGLLARRQGVASAAGEVFDAAADRYAEFFVLAGIAVFSRDSPPLLLLSLAALLGSFMVSYTTAKAEAMDVDPPKGAMRRATRAFYILVAMALVPWWQAWGPAWERGWGSTPIAKVLHCAPLSLSLAVVAVVTNASAVRRLYQTAELTRELEMPGK